MASRGHVLITDFSAGEVSPRWRSRVQGGSIPNNRGSATSLADVYRSGCEQLTNAITISQGGASKRQGFEFAALPDDTQELVQNEGDNYRMTTYREGDLDRLLVIRPNEIRVYDINTRPFTLLSAGLTMPYTEDQLAQLRFVQGENELLFLHPEWRPRIFRFLNGGYEFIDSADDNAENRFIPPEYRFRDSETPPSIAADYDVTFVIGANPQERRRFQVAVSGVESSTDSRWFNGVGTQTLIRLKQALQDNPAVKPATVEVIEIAPNDGTKFNVRYEWIVGQGNGSGVLDVDWDPPQSDDFSVDVEANVEADAGGEPLWSGPLLVLHNAVYYQCIQANRSQASNEPGTGGGAAFWLSVGASVPTDQDYTVFPDPWSADVSYGLYDRGWPRVGTFHEQRLMLDGGVAAPAVVAGSKTSQLEFLDFTLGVDDSNGVLFAIVNDKGLSIDWMISQRRLFLGTTAGLYVQEAVPLTPTQVNFQRHSMHRSAYLPALAVAGEIFHVQDNRRQIRKVQYVRDIDSWEARDLTVFAEHLFRQKEGIETWAFVDSPDPVIFAVRSDGALLTFAYQDTAGVHAWSKHNLSDPVVTVVSAYDGTQERAIVLVKRAEWNGVEFVARPSVEVLDDVTDNFFIESPIYDPADDCCSFELVGDAFDALPVYLDSYAQFTGDGTAGPFIDPRFANRAVRVVENGVYLGSFTADQTGKVTLLEPSTAGSTISIGYGYSAIIRPNRLEMSTNEGTTQTQKIRWVKPELRLLTSQLPLINGQRGRTRDQDVTYNANALFTGDLPQVNIGSDTGLTIEADLPLPFNLSGIFGLMTTEGG